MSVCRSYLSLLVVVFMLSACGGGGGGGGAAPTPPPTPDKVDGYSYTGSGYGIDHVVTPETDSADLNLSYTLSLGAATRDVYLLFTNQTLTNATTIPAVFGDVAENQGAAVATGDLFLQADAEFVPERIAQRGSPEISLFNSDPERYLNLQPAGSLAVSTQAPPPPLLDVEGTPGTFFTGTDLNQMAVTSAVCRKVVIDSFSGKTLNIWVADDSWGTCTKAHCINQAMVDAMAGKFLVNGSNNDIYGWVTNIYGAEWGDDAQVLQSNQIPADNNITILLYDISGDNATDGGTIGFFWAKDNYKSSSQPVSNARLMFYVDSVLYATPDDTWDSDDSWPKEIFGGLAHEFQHMISYYQRNVLRGVSTSVWLNEMASEVTEDFVATKLGIDGPRGVSYITDSAGSAYNTVGRLPRFCRYDYLPVTEWQQGDGDDPGETNVLNSYSIDYAFGAYLARNYGGATFFRDLVQNSLNGDEAINYALSQSVSAGETFASVLQKWGVATLLSNDSTTNVPTLYQYNTGTFIDSTLGSITYSLGSINMFNYHYAGLLGPKIYTSLPPSDTMAGRYKSSNMIYRWGTGLSGTVSKIVTIPRGSKLTVVVK